MSLSTASNWFWNWLLAFVSKYPYLSSSCLSDHQHIIHLTQPPTSSIPAQTMPISAQRCSSSGERPVSGATSSHTSVSLRCVLPWLFTECEQSLTMYSPCSLQTKGLALEQIDLLYANSTPRNSVAYRNQLIASNLHTTDVYGKGAHDRHSQEDEKKETV